MPAFLKQLVNSPAFSGILLGFAAILALIVENTNLQSWYEGFTHAKVTMQFGDYGLSKSLTHWINDGLMAIFFLLVGCEIKREVLQGHLSSREQISLPLVAALGGIVCPALIYAGFNWGNEAAIAGWAIPSATDIAFALGVMMLLGDRVPQALKVALVAIAIIDDLAAIIIIALFYTASVSMGALALAAMAIVVLFILNRLKVMTMVPYMIVGLVLWVCVLKSGVHATLAGVTLAMFIPLTNPKNPEHIPLLKLEHALHPWVAYLILPVFAFVNAGVPLTGLSAEIFLDPVTLGIILGLFLGKQIGVLGFTWLGGKIGLCSLPKGVNWTQYYGMALLTGIGFTMSLFIGNLAFSGDLTHQVSVRLGVITGSVLSGVLGYILLRRCHKKSIVEEKKVAHA